MKIAGANAYLVITAYLLAFIALYLLFVDAPRLGRKRKLQKKKIS